MIIIILHIIKKEYYIYVSQPPETEIDRNTFKKSICGVSE